MSAAKRARQGDSGAEPLAHCEARRLGQIARLRKPHAEPSLCEQERCRRAVAALPENLRASSREALAVHAARVPEDDRARTRVQRANSRVRDALGELLGGRKAASSGRPRPQRRVGPLAGTSRHTLQLVGASLDVGKVKDHPHEAFVLCVTMPFLLGLGTLGRRSLVDLVAVGELAPHPQVGIDHVEQPRRERDLQPGILEGGSAAPGARR